MSDEVGIGGVGGWIAIGLAFLLLELVTQARITRRLWRESLLLFVHLDLLAVRLVRRLYPPRFVILGNCQKRGVCCRQIVGNPPSFVKRTWLLQLFAAYHRVFHNFHPVARGPNGEVIFSCGYIKSDGRCGVYRTRPLLCRNYPVLPWFEPPKLLPGCGFRVAPRVVAKMKQRGSLPLLNPQTAVHHPSPPSEVSWSVGPLDADGLPRSVVPRRRPTDDWTDRMSSAEELAEHFEHFDDS